MNNMFFNPKHIIVKLIAIIVCVCFLWQDVVWAGGSDCIRSMQWLGEGGQETHQADSAGKPNKSDNISEVIAKANGGTPIKAAIAFLKIPTVMLGAAFSVVDAAILGLSGIDIGKEFGPFVPLFAGQLGLLALSGIRQIGFSRAQDETLVDTLLNAVPDVLGAVAQNGNGKTASNECDVYYKYLPLDNDTFTTIISQIFAFTSEELNALKNKISTAGNSNKFYALYSENPASEAGVAFEGTACVKISKGIWNVSVEKSSNAAQAERRLPEEFLVEEITKWDPGVVIFQNEFIDEAMVKLSMPNHIPAFHAKRIKYIKEETRRTFGLSFEDKQHTIYEHTRFTLIDIVTLWAAAQKKWRRYNMSIDYSTLRNVLMGIVGGLTWGVITDYADKKIHVMGRYNFLLAYISPMLTVSIYQPINGWLSKKIKLRRDRRSTNLTKDPVTGMVPNKWKAMASNLRVVETFLSVMLRLNPAAFLIYRLLYLMLFPGFMLAGAFGSSLFLNIASPNLYLVLLFIWWVSFNALNTFTSQTLSETVTGDLLHSESAMSKGYSAVFPVISAFSDYRWMTILQLASFAIGDGLIKLCFIGGIANLGILNYFVPAVALLSAAAFINELAFPILARDYNAALIINTQASRIPERGLDGLDGANHIVYAYGPVAKEKMWLDINPKDPELCDVRPIPLKNKKSLLPWIEEISAQIGYSGGLPLVKPRRMNWLFSNRVDFEFVVDETKDKTRIVTLMKRFGRIKYGKDFIVASNGNNDYEIIFYPEESDKKRAITESEILPQLSTRQKGQRRFWPFLMGLFMVFAPTKATLPISQHSRQPDNTPTTTLIQDKEKEKQLIKALKIELNGLGIDAKTTEEIVEKYQAPEPAEIQEAKQWMKKEMLITKLERENIKVVTAENIPYGLLTLEGFKLIIINGNILAEEGGLKDKTLKLAVTYATVRYQLAYLAPIIREKNAWQFYLAAAEKLGFKEPQSMGFADELLKKAQKIYQTAKKLHTAFKMLAESKILLFTLNAGIKEIDFTNVKVLDNEVKMELLIKGARWLATIDAQGKQSIDLKILDIPRPLPSVVNERPYLLTGGSASAAAPTAIHIDMGNAASAGMSGIKIINPEAVENLDAQGFIYDFDETIFYGRSFWPQITSGLYAEMLKLEKPTKELIDLTMSIAGTGDGNAFKRFFEQYGNEPTVKLWAREKGFTVGSQDAIEWLVKEFNTRMNKRVEELKNSEWFQNPPIYNGVREMMQEITARRRFLCIFSGSQEKGVQELAVYLNLTDLCDGRVYGYNSKTIPAAGPFESLKSNAFYNIMTMNNLDAKQTIAIGDAPADIIAAKENGCVAIGIVPRDRPEAEKNLIDAGADIIIFNYDNWQELFDMMIKKPAQTEPPASKSARMSGNEADDFQNFTKGLNGYYPKPDDTKNHMQNLDTERSLLGNEFLNEFEALLSKYPAPGMVSLEEARKKFKDEGPEALLDWLDQDWPENHKRAIKTYIETIELPVIIYAIQIAQFEYLSELFFELKKSGNLNEYYTRLKGGRGLFAFRQFPANDLSTAKIGIMEESEIANETRQHTNKTMRIMGRGAIKQSFVIDFTKKMDRLRKARVDGKFLGYNGFSEAEINFLGVKMKGADFETIFHSPRLATQNGYHIVFLNDENTYADSGVKEQGAPFYLCLMKPHSENVTEGISISSYADGQIMAETFYPFRPYDAHFDKHGITLLTDLSVEGAIFDVDSIYECLIGGLDLDDVFSRRGLNAATLHPFYRIVYSSIGRYGLISQDDRHDWNNITPWSWSMEELVKHLNVSNDIGVGAILACFLNSKKISGLEIGGLSRKWHPVYRRMSKDTASLGYIAAALQALFGPQKESLHNHLKSRLKEKGEEAANVICIYALFGLLKNIFLPVFHGIDAEDKPEKVKIALMLAALWSYCCYLEGDRMVVDWQKFQELPYLIWHDTLQINEDNIASWVKEMSNLQGEEARLAFENLADKIDASFNWEFLVSRFEPAMKMAALCMLCVLTGSIMTGHESEEIKKAREIEYNEGYTFVNEQSPPDSMPMGAEEWALCVKLLKKFGYAAKEGGRLRLLHPSTNRDVIYYYAPRLKPGEGVLFKDDSVSNIRLLGDGEKITSEDLQKKDLVPPRSHPDRLPIAIFCAKVDEHGDLILSPRAVSKFNVSLCGFKPGDEAFLAIHGQKAEIYKEENDSEGNKRYIAVGAVASKPFSIIIQPFLLSGEGLDPKHQVLIMPNFDVLGGQGFNPGAGEALIWDNGFDAETPARKCAIDELISAEGEVDGFTQLTVGEDGMLYVGNSPGCAYDLSRVTPALYDEPISLAGAKVIFYRSRFERDKFNICFAGTFVLSDTVEALTGFLPALELASGAERIPLHYNGELLLHNLNPNQRKQAAALLDGVARQAPDILNEIPRGVQLQAVEIAEPRQNMRQGELAIPSGWLGREQDAEVVQNAASFFRSCADPVLEAERVFRLYQRAEDEIKINKYSETLTSEELQDALKSLQKVDTSDTSADFRNPEHRRQFKDLLEEIGVLREQCSTMLKTIEERNAVIQKIMDAMANAEHINRKALRKTLEFVLEDKDTTHRNKLTARQGRCFLEPKALDNPGNNPQAEKSIMAGTISDAYIKPKGNKVTIDSAGSRVRENDVILVVIPTLTTDEDTQKVLVQDYAYHVFYQDGIPATEYYCSKSELKQLSQIMELPDTNETYSMLYKRFEAHKDGVRFIELIKSAEAIMPVLKKNLDVTIELAGLGLDDNARLAVRMGLLDLAIYCILHSSDSVDSAQNLARPINELIDYLADEYLKENPAQFLSDVLPIAIRRSGCEMLGPRLNKAVKDQLENYAVWLRHFELRQLQFFSENEIDQLVKFFRVAVDEEETQQEPIPVEEKAAATQPEQAKYRPKTLKSHYCLPLGGAEDIGASAYLVRMGSKLVLVDFGARVDAKNGKARIQLPDMDKLKAVLETQKLDAIILTHSHSDHIQGLPLLLRKLKEWEMEIPPIFATGPTKEFAKEILLDAARIMQRDAPEEALFSEDEVQPAIDAITVLNEDTWYKLGDDCKFYLLHAGHIIGAVAPILVDKETSIMLTGDFSRTDKETIEKMHPLPLERVDVVVSEATNGAKAPVDYHQQLDNFKIRLKEMAPSGITDEPGAVLIPVLSLGRAQEILFILAQLKESGQIPSTTTIYLDGKLPKAINGIAARFLPQEKARIFKYKGFYEDVDARLRNILISELKSGRFRESFIIVSSSGDISAGPSQSYAQAIVESRSDRCRIFGVNFMDEQSSGARLRNAQRRGEAWKCFEEFMLSGHPTSDEIIDMINDADPDAVMFVHGSRSARKTLSESIGLQGLRKRKSIITAKTGEEWQFVVNAGRQKIFDDITDAAPAIFVDRSQAMYSALEQAEAMMAGML